MGKTADAVRQARNPQEALLALAEAIDGLRAQPPADEWSEWAAPQDQERTRIEGDESHTEVVIPGPSPEKRDFRAHFEANYLKLSEHLPAGEDWHKAFVEGGPRWLYYGNRDLFMSYPQQIRAAMVQDVIDDSPEEAHEIGRDVLKQAGETGPGSVAMGTDLGPR